jgi:hypothetical protein
VSFPRDADFDAISEKEIFLEARDRLQIAVDAESTNRTHAKYDLEFREGLNHWDQLTATSASMDEPELTINLTDALCQRVENNIKQQRPRGKCHPVGDGADIETAEVINGIGRHVETRSEASVAYDQAARSALTNGWGYFRLIAEYVSPRSFQKDLRILPIRNIFTVYMDPAAIMPSGADADWCLVTIKQKRTEFRRLHPRAEMAAWNDVGADEPNHDWEDDEQIRLAEYFRIVEEAEKLYQLRDQQNQEFGVYESELPRDAKGEIDYPRLMLKGLRIDGDRESSRDRVEWFELNGLKVVSREILPGQWLPIFRVEGNATDIDGKMYRRGMVRAMIDPQRMVDYGEVAKIKRLGLAPKAPWIGAEGQFDGHEEWDDANTKPYSKLVYKPVTIATAQGEMPLPPPQRQPPAQIEQGFAEFVQGMRTNLLAVAGMPNEPGADSQGQVVSGVALQRRQMLSDHSHYHIYDNLTLAIAQCWRVMLEWVPAYYREPGRIQRIIGDDTIPKMITLNQQVEESPGVNKVKNDLSVGRYDVVMDTGPGFETKREEGAENLLELLKSPAIADLISKVGMDLVFRSIDHPYMQELADRIAALTPKGLEDVMEQLPERAKALVRSLAAHNQQLQQQLQQTQQDLKFGITKAHLAATTKAHDTEVRAQTAMHDTQVRADTAKEDRELQAGVDVFIEGMKHGHDTRMAEADAQRLVENGGV